MIKEDEIITLDDNKDYYVLDSLINNNNNYIMIGEINKERMEVTNNVKIMYYDNISNMVRKVTDPKSLFQLERLFADKFSEAE